MLGAGTGLVDPFLTSPLGALCHDCQLIILVRDCHSRDLAAHSTTHASAASPTPLTSLASLCLLAITPRRPAAAAARRFGYFTFFLIQDPGPREIRSVDRTCRSHHQDSRDRQYQGNSSFLKHVTSLFREHPAKRLNGSSEVYTKTLLELVTGQERFCFKVGRGSRLFIHFAGWLNSTLRLSFATKSGTSFPMKVEKDPRRRSFQAPKIRHFGDVTELTRQEGPADPVSKYQFI